MPVSSHGDTAPVSTVATDTKADAIAPDPRLVADLVTANHILFDQHVVDAFGHVSVRHDKRLDRFLLLIAKQIGNGGCCRRRGCGGGRR